MKKTPKLGLFLYKNIEFFSWIFIIITIWSLISVGISGYNFYVYGNCNGEQSDDFCIFDPTGANSQVSQVGEACTIDGLDVEKNDPTIKDLDLSQFPSKGIGKKIILFGCYGCEYTRQFIPTLNEILKEEEVEYTFVHFSTKAGSEYLHAYEYCMYDQDPNEYWKFNNMLFEMPVEETFNEEIIKDKINNFNINKEEFEECLVDNNTQNKLQAIKNQLTKTNIYGTPTVYIDGNFITGPKPKRVYTRLLK